MKLPDAKKLILKMFKISRFWRLSIQGGLLLWFVFGGWVQAREDWVPGSRYTSAAGAAMGDAYLPLGNDAGTGLFYNPADLAKIRKFELEPINIMAYANNSYVNNAGSGFLQAPNLGSYISTLQSNSGQNMGFGGQAMVSGGGPGFGFGVLGVSQVAAQANSNSTITYRSLFQIIPAMGYGIRLLDGVFRFGYSLQWVNESLGTETATSSSSLGYNQGLAQGSGFSENLGMAITAPIMSLPSLNFVVRNLFNTYYNSYLIFPMAANSSGLPSMDPMSEDVSLSFQPRLGRGGILNVVFEYRDLSNVSGDPFFGHVAMGLEVDFKNTIFLRGGWGGGYPSAGIGVGHPGAEFSLTWYTEEIGTHYLSQGDTRYLFQYKVRSF